MFLMQVTRYHCFWCAEEFWLVVSWLLLVRGMWGLCMLCLAPRRKLKLLWTNRYVLESPYPLGGLMLLDIMFLWLSEVPFCLLSAMTIPKAYTSRIPSDYPLM